MFGNVKTLSELPVPWHVQTLKYDAYERNVGTPGRSHLEIFNAQFDLFTITQVARENP